jgi:cytochrome P450
LLQVSPRQQNVGVYSLLNELYSFSIIASDTTSTTLAALFFYLSRYPDARSRVTNEIRSRFSTVEDVVMGPALNTCSYLRACVNEALRLCPPVPGPLLREVPSPGAVIDGLPIPGGGYEVGTCTYSIHRNPEYFPDPHTYMPERWLASNRKETGMKAIDRAHSAFAPFSVGSRSCIGKKLAMTEMMIIVATMLVKFDFEVADGPDGLLGGVRAEGAEGMCRVNDFQISDHLNAVKDGPMIKFRRRVGEKGHTPSPPL